jgi:ABC-type amino acid transport substrate-binding protein
MNTMNRVAYQLFYGSIAVFLGAASATARDTDFVVHTSHIPDYIVKIGPTLDQSSGLMIEIAAAAFKNANLPVRVTPEVPWARAQSEAMGKPGGILVILARTPAREERWRWLSVAYTDKVYAYTLKGKPVLSNYEEIKATKLRVGVKLGSASESLLKGMAVTVDVVVTIEQMFKMLLLGRLDVVVVCVFSRITATRSPSYCSSDSGVKSASGSSLNPATNSDSNPISGTKKPAMQAG